MSKSLTLLDDDQVISFIIQGYLLLEPEYSPGLNETVCEQLNATGGAPVNLRDDPHGQALLRQAPALHDIFGHPEVEGAAISLLGNGYEVYERYNHMLKPGWGGMGWHQDDVNIRHHQVRRLMFLYYPQDVTPDMGPTFIVPGTHFRNMPTDRMQTYGNIRHQVALTVKAGTVAVVHYDLWHSASHNSSDKIRYMIKLYLDRKGEPSGANWNHDPAKAHGHARNRFHQEHVCGSGSDLYKERHLRWEMWQHLLGNADESNRVRNENEPAEPYRARAFQGYVGEPRF